MPSEPSYGNLTLASGSATPLVASDTIVATGVVIKAHPDNTDPVFIGNTSGVLTTTGFPLAAGEQQSFDVAWVRGGNELANLENVYVIGTTADVVRYWFI